MSEWMFQRDAIGEFRFVRCGFDAATGVAQLVYAFDDGPELVETVTVPGAPFELDDARAHAVAQAPAPAAPDRRRELLQGRGAGRDPHRRLRRSMPTPPRCWNRVYLNGLGEFAYRNGLDLHGRIRFPHGATAPMQRRRPLGLREHALVAIGGGKDSLVSIEALRALGIDADRDLDRRLAADPRLRRTHRPAHAQHRPPAGAATVRVQPPGRVERPYPGDRDQLGDPGAGRACCTASTRWCSPTSARPATAR